MLGEPWPTQLQSSSWPLSGQHYDNNHKEYKCQVTLHPAFPCPLTYSLMIPNAYSFVPYITFLSQNYLFQHAWTKPKCCSFNTTILHNDTSQQFSPLSWFLGVVGRELDVFLFLSGEITATAEQAWAGCLRGRPEGMIFPRMACCFGESPPSSNVCFQCPLTITHQRTQTESLC